jgi:hypothetical protein
VLFLERSFLLTAAGQFRLFTGFPFEPDLKDRAPESSLNIEQAPAQVNVELRQPAYLGTDE